MRDTLTSLLMLGALLLAYALVDLNDRTGFTPSGSDRPFLVSMEISK